jgi:hypothetical protein
MKLSFSIALLQSHEEQRLRQKPPEESRSDRQRSREVGWELKEVSRRLFSFGTHDSKTSSLGRILVPFSGEADGGERSVD